MDTRVVAYIDHHLDRANTNLAELGEHRVLQMAGPQGREQFAAHVQREKVTPEVASDLQDQYQKYFKDMLHHFGTDSPTTLSGEARTEFFNTVKRRWVRGKGPRQIRVDTHRRAEVPMTESASAATQGGISSADVSRMRDTILEYLEKLHPEVKEPLDQVTNGALAFRILHNSGAFDIVRDYPDAVTTTALKKIFPKAVFQAPGRRTVASVFRREVPETGHHLVFLNHLGEAHVSRADDLILAHVPLLHGMRSTIVARTPEEMETKLAAARLVVFAGYDLLHEQASTDPVTDSTSPAAPDSQFTDQNPPPADAAQDSDRPQQYPNYYTGADDIVPVDADFFGGNTREIHRVAYTNTPGGVLCMKIREENQRRPGWYICSQHPAAGQQRLFSVRADRLQYDQGDAEAQEAYPIMHFNYGVNT